MRSLIVVSHLNPTIDRVGSPANGQLDITFVTSVRFMRSSLVPRFIKKTGVLEQPQVSQPIRELRELTGLTQTQLAALVGVAYGTINRWKNGRMQPSQLALKQIKAVLEEINHSSDVELQQRSQQLLDKYFLPSTDRGVDADESNFRQPL